MKKNAKSPLRVVSGKMKETVEEDGEEVEKRLQSIEKEMLNIIKLIDDNIYREKRIE